jgi:acylpyruvate hydrolase
MKIIRFHSPDGCRLGVLTGDGLADLSELRPDAPRDIAALLKLGPAVLAEVETSAKAARPAQIRQMEQVKVALPIANLSKFICLGLNYQDHVAESKNIRPQYPTLFLRVPTSLVAHGESIERPQASVQLDYEAELAVIIGRSLRNASSEEALSAVAGYSCFNDGSVREFQRHTIQWTMGKNFDRTGGFGPLFVSADELPPGAAGLKISTERRDTSVGQHREHALWRRRNAVLHQPRHHAGVRRCCCHGNAGRSGSCPYAAKMAARR